MNGSSFNKEQVSPAAVKSYLQQEEARIRNAHFQGASGSEIVQLRTSLIDRILGELHASRGPAFEPALIAVGGYGRGELNPRSDIDILLLCRKDAQRQQAPKLLYALWDAGLDIGYSVRTIAECVELARQDIKVRTSLLESRLIAGDAVLYRDFLKTMREDVLYWRSRDFIAKKIAERQSVRQKFGGSLYLREPNIKESPGGLRDFHTTFWIAAVHFRIASLGELVAAGVITAGQYAVFLRARSFLWGVRNEIHYLSERKNDQLTFDLQEQAARDFRYRDSSHLLAVERFMKSYFIYARNIREFSAIVTNAALGGRAKPLLPRRTVPLGPVNQIGKILIPTSDDVINSDPALIPAVFRIRQERHAEFSERLALLIREQRLGDETRCSSAAAKDFLAVLDNYDGCVETLTLMRDLRFLGRYLPEFRSVQHLARHDFYHRYTVDEHILTAIRNLQDLWNGRYPALITLADALQGLRKRWVLTLAVLLHDLGKAYRTGHDQRSAEIAERVLDRLGVGGEDRERVLFLVRNHLAMSSLSQRRELADARVIAAFANLVRDRERLAMLYLLTYADIAAVNPTAWTQWKAALLQELYTRTAASLEQRTVTEEEERARLEAAHDRIRAAAGNLFAPDETEDVLSVLPEKYVLRTPLSRVIDHLDMIRRLPREGLVIRHRHYRERGYTELTVCAYDAYGMFYRTAGTLASKNLNILRAQVYTTRNGIMLDSFQVTDADGRLFDYEDAWESITRELRKSLLEKRRPVEPLRPGHPRLAAESVSPVIEFDNEASDHFTIIDITARDRVGLLYDITRTLYDLNLDIGSAKINTEGVKAMDSFYVTDLLREKIVEEGRLERIRAALMRTIGEA